MDLSNKKRIINIVRDHNVKFNQETMWEKIVEKKKKRKLFLLLWYSIFVLCSFLIYKVTKVDTFDKVVIIGNDAMKTKFNIDSFSSVINPTESNSDIPRKSKLIVESTISRPNDKASNSRDLLHKTKAIKKEILNESIIDLSNIDLDIEFKRVRISSDQQSSSLIDSSIQYKSHASLPILENKIEAQNLKSMSLNKFTPMPNIVLDRMSLKMQQAKITNSKNWIIQSSIGYVFKDQKPKSNDTISMNLLKIREKSEAQLQELGLGVDYHIETKSNLFFNLGLSYRNVSEKFNFTEIEKEDLGNFEQKKYVRVKASTYNYYNSYNFFDVRTGLGYFIESKKVKYGMDVAFSYSIYTSAIGKNIRLNSRVSDLKNSFSSRGNMNYHFGLAIDYKLDSNSSLMIGPSYSNSLKDLSTVENPLTLQYKFVRFNVGIVKKI
jgi:hypothetical protein